MILPKDLQDKYFPDGECKQNWGTATTGSCDLPKLPTAEPACGICNADSRFGSLAKSIIEAAGQQFNVPAAAIYATMLHEGADWPEYLSGLKDNSQVKSWSVPVGCPNYKPMPKCDEGNVGATPPFGHLEGWFYNDAGNDSVWTASQTVDPQRKPDQAKPSLSDKKKKVSRCNFIDATFGSAKEIWEGTSSVVPAAQEYQYCGDPSWGFALHAGSRPSACSQMTKQMFGMSQVSVAGQCPEPGQNKYEQE